MFVSDVIAEYKESSLFDSDYSSGLKD